MSVQAIAKFLLIICFVFQYILCVGSSLNSSKSNLMAKVSIHPMCRFKSGFSSYLNPSISFQYILCVGSSGARPPNAKLYSVSIHPMCRFKLNSVQGCLNNCCFNTSYVSVQVGSASYWIFPYI